MASKKSTISLDSIPGVEILENNAAEAYIGGVATSITVSNWSFERLRTVDLNGIGSSNTTQFSLPVNSRYVNLVTEDKSEATYNFEIYTRFGDPIRGTVPTKNGIGAMDLIKLYEGENAPTGIRITRV